MKKPFLFILFLILSTHLFAQYKGFIMKDTKIFCFVINMSHRYKIIGYVHPDVRSKKLICSKNMAGCCREVVANLERRLS